MENHATSMYMPTEKAKHEHPSLVTKRSVKFTKKEDHPTVTINGLKEGIDQPDCPPANDHVSTVTQFFCCWRGGVG